jgi:hypothetical protein
MSKPKLPTWPADRSPFDIGRRALGDKTPWHVGRVVTRRRAMIVAARLFPDDVTDGTDCKAEIGREGLPCRNCARANAW